MKKWIVDSSGNKVPAIYAGNSEEWRKWLNDNHEKEKKVGLIKYKKHTGKPALSHHDSMQDAICYGWIDTTVKKLDDDTYVRYFMRRGPNSKWSSATIKYATKLIKEGKMSPFGLKMYQEGLAKPLIDAGIPLNPEMPQDLKNELDKHEIARKYFTNLAPSYRRNYLRWIEKAKRKETRDKRIKELILRSSQGKKLF